jgi:DNA-binding NarL/FixJ family response regulator
MSDSTPRGQSHGGLNPADRPRWVGAWAEAAIAARGNWEVLKRIVDRSPVPMLVVDAERRYIEANQPARLAFRASLAELRERRIDDLTPPHQIEGMTEAWARLIDTGCVAGPYDVTSMDGTGLEVSYFALAHVLDGLHLIMFLPAFWPETELDGESELHEPLPSAPLTPREREVLQMAADGRNAPAIARELYVSPVTVNTHFANIYAKLGVNERAAAVARAMRLGLIS